MSKQIRHSFVEIFVHFIQSSTPVLRVELVFKDEAGVKQKSSKFKAGELAHWNIDTFVHFGSVSSFSETDRSCIVTLEPTPVLL